MASVSLRDATSNSERRIHGSDIARRCSGKTIVLLTRQDRTHLRALPTSVFDWVADFGINVSMEEFVGKAAK